MTKLVIYECKKFFLKPSLCLIVLILFCINFTNIFTIYKENTYLNNEGWREVHHQIYSEYSGQMTVGKIENLLSLHQPLEMKISDRTASTRTDDPNTFTGNVYSDYYLLSWLFVEPMEYMWTYASNADNIVSKSEENIDFYAEYGNSYKVRENEQIASIFSERSVENFEYTEMVNEYTHYDFSSILLFLFIIYVVTTIFVYEKECKMDNILLSNKNGGTKIVIAKIIAISIFVLLTTLLFGAFDLISFSISYGTSDGLLLPYYAIRDFSQSYFGGNIISFGVVNTAMKAMGFITIAMIFMFIAQNIKNPLIIFTINLGIGASLLWMQEFFENLSSIFIKTLNPYSMIANESLLGRCEFVNIFDYPVPSPLFSCVVTALVGVLFAVLTIITSQKNTFVKGVL